MRKIIWILVALLIGFVAYASFQNRAVLAQNLENIFYQSPCDTAIKYRIGSIDGRFNITREEFMQNILKAVSTWNNAYGKDIFIYSADGDLTVSLVYDDRQMLTTQISKIDKELLDKKSKIEPAIEEYERKVLEFEKKLASLNDEIDYWNSQGGAPPEKYKELSDKQLALQQDAQYLNQLAASINQSTNQYNSRINDLNQTISEYNEQLKYRPEEGTYVKDENGRRIVVYFYISNDELVHTLAHELGHALSIGHINNENAIMYPRTTLVTYLSPDDITALEYACRKISMWEILNHKANYAVSIIKHHGLKGLLDELRRENFTKPQ